MAGVSTGINLLSCSSRSFLSYSTSLMTTKSRVAVATPNPDYHGATGYTTIANRGVGGTDDSFWIELGNTGTYPNYTLLASIKPEYMGNYTGTMVPSIKDSAGLVGGTSGPVALDLTRNFCWGNAVAMPTTLSVSTNSSTSSSALIFNSLELFGFASVSSDVVGVYFYGNREWNTMVSILQDAGAHNEIKFEHVSGSAAWDVVTGNNLTSLKSKGTYYNINNVAVRTYPVTTPSTVSSVVRATFRNKNNTAITFTQDFTLEIIRT